MRLPLLEADFPKLAAAGYEKTSEETGFPPDPVLTTASLGQQVILVGGGGRIPTLTGPLGPSSEMKQWGASFEHFAGWAIAPVSRLADNSGSKRSLYTQYTGRRCQRHFPQIGVERTTGFRLTWHVSCQMELGRANAVRVRTLRISPWTHLNVTATSVFTWGFIQFTHMGARQ